MRQGIGMGILDLYEVFSGQMACSEELFVLRCASDFKKVVARFSLHFHVYCLIVISGISRKRIR